MGINLSSEIISNLSWSHSKRSVIVGIEPNNRPSNGSILDWLSHLFLSGSHETGVKGAADRQVLDALELELVTVELDELECLSVAADYTALREQVVGHGALDWYVQFELVRAPFASRQHGHFELRLAG